MQIAIIAGLIVLNGLLAMSELAVVSSRRHRLQKRADSGSHGAAVAIELAERPGRFLSTVQIGITLVGIIAGAFGGAAIADDLAGLLAPVVGDPETAHSIAMIIVVTITTYFTLVIGELVPKEIAIRYPEGVAQRVARPLRLLSIITRPIVILLSASSRLVARALVGKKRAEAGVTEEEVTVMVRQGAESGVFRRAEAGMIEGVFRLDDIRADALMTPRVDVAWIPVNAEKAEIGRLLRERPHAIYPVCERNVDAVIGTVSGTRLAQALIESHDFDLRDLCDKAAVVPDSADAGRLVSLAAETGSHFFVVVGERGGVDGIVTAHDLAEAVFGDLGPADARRNTDGNWVLSGRMPIEEAEAALGVTGLKADGGKRYGTVAGFVMARLGRIPKVGEELSASGYVFRVERLQGMRVRAVLATREADA